MIVIGGDRVDHAMPGFMDRGTMLGGFQRPLALVFIGFFQKVSGVIVIAAPLCNGNPIERGHRRATASRVVGLTMPPSINASSAFANSCAAVKVRSIPPSPLFLASSSGAAQPR